MVHSCFFPAVIGDCARYRREPVTTVTEGISEELEESEELENRAKISKKRWNFSPDFLKLPRKLS
jgi:hypothetical protein